MAIILIKLRSICVFNEINSANTRFIQFGRKYKAFAKVVPSGKTVIYALQMAKKHLALLVAFR
jgi:hypothetical protein